MKTRSVEEVGRELSELVEAARRGEVTEIVRSGEHVASLVPPQNTPPSGSMSEPEEHLLSRLESEGLLLRNPNAPDECAVDELPDGSSGVLDALFEERDENW